MNNFIRSQTLKAGASNYSVTENVIDWGVQLILLTFVVCMFVPLVPDMPQAGLDPSWAYSMSYAASRGMAFGRDIVFTYGPFSSLYTWIYQAEIDNVILFSSMYLAVVYGFSVFSLTFRRSRFFISVLLVLFAFIFMWGASPTRDALFYSCPLIVGLCCIVNSERNSARVKMREPVRIALLFFLFSILGLLPLVKGSIIILCVGVIGLAVCFFCARADWKAAGTVVLSPALSTIFFWLLSGQKILDLPIYFTSMLPIISGYTEAMAYHGEMVELGVYILAVISIFLLIAFENSIRGLSRVFLLCLVLGCLFLSFKSGFVRHDSHAIMAGTTLLFCLCFMIFILTPDLRLCALIIPLLCGIYINNCHLTNFGGMGALLTFHEKYAMAWASIPDRLMAKARLDKEFDTANVDIDKVGRIKRLPGTTDIYSFNQSYLLASGNTWSPRPIPQSYSVYTPALAEKNRQHLLGKNAPDNIVFKVEPIDRRFPALEDGPSWPVLLTHYNPVILENSFLYLKRNETRGEVAQTLIEQVAVTLGQPVVVPEGDFVIFAKVAVHKTMLGKLADIFYKPSQLSITVNSAGGSKVFRLPSQMAEAGFVISPLIEETREFGFLYGGTGYLPEKRVQSFSVAPDKNRGQWGNTYEVSFLKVEQPIHDDLAQRYQLDQPFEVAQPENVRVVERCDGHVDSINKGPVRQGLEIGRLLTTVGWVAQSVEKGIVAEKVLLVLTDQNGKRKFFKARNAGRPDVGAHFKQRALDASGFEIELDVTHLSGRYTLGVGYAEGDGVRICPQFAVPILLKGS